MNWTHGNALDLDADGNLLVSFRSLSEITKIDTRTGAVLWRMGGLRNQFAFPDSGPPFLGQHGARAADGELVLLDNFGEAEGSRAERYVLDETGRTARLTGMYVPTFATRAALGGLPRICRGATPSWLSATAGSCRSTTAMGRSSGRSKGIRATSSGPSASARCTTRRSAWRGS